MSKKIAEGIGGLVLDVKTGDGAFMKTRRALARAGRVAGRDRRRVGRAHRGADHRAWTRRSAATVGNAIEVIESIETLKGRGPRDLETLSVLLAARMLVVAGRRAGRRARRSARARGARDRAPASRSSARSSRTRAAIPRVVDDYAPPAVGARSHDVVARRARLRRRAQGRARSAARRSRSAPAASRLDDVIDPGVGIEVVARPGDRVGGGEPVLIVHHRGGRGLAEAQALLAQAVEVADAPPAEAADRGRPELRGDAAMTEAGVAARSHARRARPVRAARRDGARRRAGVRRGLRRCWRSSAACRGCSRWSA